MPALKESSAALSAGTQLPLDLTLTLKEAAARMVIRKSILLGAAMALSWANEADNSLDSSHGVVLG